MQFNSYKIHTSKKNLFHLKAFYYVVMFNFNSFSPNLRNEPTKLRYTLHFHSLPVTKISTLTVSKSTTINNGQKVFVFQTSVMPPKI